LYSKINGSISCFRYTNKRNFLEYLTQLKDPRCSQGSRHDLTLILLITIMSNMSGYIVYRSIGDFIIRNRAGLLSVLKPKKVKLHSFDTIHQMVRLDFLELSQQFYYWAKRYIDIGENNFEIIAQAMRLVANNIQLLYEIIL
jgi:hypothetical protein